LPAPADGPDAIEGAFFILQQKTSANAAGAMVIGERNTNSKRI